MVSKKEIKRSFDINFDLDVWVLLEELQEKTKVKRNHLESKRPMKHIIQDAIRLYSRIKKNDPTFDVADYRVIAKSKEV